MAQQRKVSSKPKIEKISLELESLNLISGPGTKNVFDRIFKNILKKKITKSSSFIKEAWSLYLRSRVYNNDLNGNVFEGLLAILFYREGILPIFHKAKVAFVPNVEFDFVAYSKQFGPVILSAKTSLRERYKQAEIEGMMMKQVHKRAKSYLLTLDLKEAGNVSKKIDDGRVLYIDKVCVPTEPEFDDLIKELKTYCLYEPGSVPVVQSKKIIRKNL